MSTLVFMTPYEVKTMRRVTAGTPDEGDIAYLCGGAVRPLDLPGGRALWIRTDQAAGEPRNRPASRHLAYEAPGAAQEIYGAAVITGMSDGQPADLTDAQVAHTHEQFKAAMS